MAKFVHRLQKTKDIYHSYEACKTKSDFVTLPDFLPGYELVGEDQTPEFGGGGFYAPTPEACETECYTRRKVVYDRTGPNK